MSGPDDAASARSARERLEDASRSMRSLILPWWASAARRIGNEDLAKHLELSIVMWGVAVDDVDAAAARVRAAEERLSEAQRHLRRYRRIAFVLIGWQIGYVLGQALSWWLQR